jgi:hypothetical protein
MRERHYCCARHTHLSESDCSYCRFYSCTDTLTLADALSVFITDSSQVVKGVDCVGRDAARELAYTVGLRGAAVPGIFKAAAPSLNEEDKQVLYTYSNSVRPDTCHIDLRQLSCVRFMVSATSQH